MVYNIHENVFFKISHESEENEKQKNIWSFWSYCVILTTTQWNIFVGQKTKNV